MERYGIKPHVTSEGEIFETYWEVFNGLREEPGVSIEDIITIRRMYSMFGPNVPKDFWQALTSEQMKEYQNKIKQ